MGRPSDYTPEIADQICALIAEGLSVRSICKREDMPSVSAVFCWLRTREAFQQQYARAKEQSADVFAEDINEIADDGSNDWMASNDPDNPGYKLNGEHVQRSKLRLEARKWLASKLKPKRYGDKLEHSGSVDVSLSQLITPPNG